MCLFSVFLCYFAFLTLIGSQCNASESKEFYDLEDHQRLFKVFLKEYNKYYDGEEYDVRLKIFKENLQKINELNKQSKSAVYAINFFSDISKEEFQKYNGLKQSHAETICAKKPYTKNLSVPDKLDYREKNMVTAVKDQGMCGSCYAFSAIGVIEGQYAKKNSKLVQFSEQQIVDCDKANGGCAGGLMTEVFSYISSDGIEFQSDYSYVGVKGSCKKDANKSKVKVSNCSQLTFADEESIKYALYEYGPLSIGLDSTSLMLYHKGIVSNCQFSSLDHGLVLVGYGTENDIPYWLIKNSWKTTWGEEGYLRIRRGHKLCGMGDEVNVAFIE